MSYVSNPIKSDSEMLITSPFQIHISLIRFLARRKILDKLIKLLLAKGESTIYILNKIQTIILSAATSIIIYIFNEKKNIFLNTSNTLNKTRNNITFQISIIKYFEVLNAALDYIFYVKHKMYF